MKRTRFKDNLMAAVFIAGIIGVIAFVFLLLFLIVWILFGVGHWLWSH